MTTQLADAIGHDKTGGYRCPRCAFATRIVDSRQGTAGSIRRRRFCLSADCAFRFTTFELQQESQTVDPGAFHAQAKAALVDAEQLVGRLQVLVKAIDAKVTLADLESAYVRNPK